MTEKLSNSLQLLQTQTLNQNLIQALTILTIPTYDLESYLEKESESNPLIKITPRSDIRDREERYVNSQSSKKSDSYLSFLENTACYEKSLYDTLNEQLGFLKLDDNTRFVCKIIISSLDNTGLCPYSKDEILELYINTIYYGNGYYDIKSASIGYFGKLPKYLSNSEAIMLVGIPNAPSVYNPKINPELAEQRKKQVIQKMKE